MRRSEYLKQLEIDLERWAQLGLIERKSADAMRQNAGPADRQYSLSGILSMLGIILLSCAAIVFIGANWQILPRLAKLGLLVGLMGGAYIGAAILAQRARPVFADAALLLGSVLFGANIMLIGQIYHINAGWPNGVLLWAGGTLAAAFLAPSRACAVLALILFCIWSGGITFGDNWVMHWPFLAVLGVMILLARFLKFRALAHLILLSFVAWSVANGIAFADDLTEGEFPYFIAMMVTLGLAMWLGGTVAGKIGARFGGLISGYGLFFLTIVAFFIQIAEGGPVDAEMVTLSIFIMGAIVAGLVIAGLGLGVIAAWDALIAIALGVAALANCALGDNWPTGVFFLYACLYLAYIAWLLTYGMRTHHGFAVNLAFVAFGVEVFYLYFQVFGTMLQQSALFAIGGVLFLIAAFALERLRRKVIPGGPRKGAQ